MVYSFAIMGSLYGETPGLLLRHRKHARKVHKPRPRILDCVSEFSQRFILLDMTTPMSLFASVSSCSASIIPSKHAASYKNSETVETIGKVSDDVTEALQRWHSSGIKVYIYSQYSREAQRRFIGKSNYGDLRKYLCGYFIKASIGQGKNTSKALQDTLSFL